MDGPFQYSSIPCAFLLLTIGEAIHYASARWPGEGMTKVELRCHVYRVNMGTTLQSARALVWARMRLSASQKPLKVIKIIEELVDRHATIPMVSHISTVTTAGLASQSTPLGTYIGNRRMSIVRGCTSVEPDYLFDEVFDSISVFLFAQVYSYCL